LIFKCRIMLWTIKIRCENFFKKVDYIDCKIIGFEVKKWALFTPSKTSQQTLNPLGLKHLYYTKLRLLILWWEIELKIYQKRNKSKKSSFSFFKGSSSRRRYEIIENYEIAHNANMELENVNPNGGNVVASNLIKVNFFFLKNCENCFKKQRSYVIFPIRCHDCPKNKIPHIIHLTNQHWMN
jgi:hypothetical protein